MSKDKNIILSVENIVNRFGSQTVHDGVSFDIKRGEIVGLIGGSGTGKSVLLKTMVGLRKPDSGKVIIAGEEVHHLAPKQKASTLAMLFQEGALFSSLTVAENIMLPLKEYTDLPEETQARLVQLKLALVGLPDDAAIKRPAQLSGGMSTRAALARALAMDPMILFLDEPTAGLDPILASAFDDLILNLNKSLGVTVVMATHDVDSLFTICDRVAVLIDHKVIIDTLPHLEKDKHTWVKEFFHGPRARNAKAAAKHAEESHGNQ